MPRSSTRLRRRKRKRTTERPARFAFPPCLTILQRSIPMSWGICFSLQQEDATMAQVKFKGNPVNLVGPTLKAGDAAPDFECLTGLEIVKLGGTPAKARLFSVVPSLDTPVCSMQTKKFNDGVAALKDKAACYTVS